MQDTHGSGKEMYGAGSMKEMLYSYVNTYAYIIMYRFIEEIQGTEFRKKKKTI